jgi:hypothetical protein
MPDLQVEAREDASAATEALQLLAWCLILEEAQSDREFSGGVIAVINEKNQEDEPTRTSLPG